MKLSSLNLSNTNGLEKIKNKKQKGNDQREKPTDLLNGLAISY